MCKCTAETDRRSAGLKYADREFGYGLIQKRQWVHHLEKAPRQGRCLEGAVFRLGWSRGHSPWVFAADWTMKRNRGLR